MTAVLTACGGGGGGSADSAGPQAGAAPTTAPAAVTQDEAARFLAQATYGVTEADIAVVQASGHTAWLNAQFAKPQTLHRDYVDQMTATLAAYNATVSPTQFRESYWAQALRGEDQLRQRAAFALSQIFVVSFVDGTLASQTRGVAAYYDMLGAKAFGTYRDLLESVALHPMMGIYLSSLRNQKEDPATGRIPDENFAREVMQLFSLGLYELNTDGSYKGGAPVETYTGEDVKGLAKVFTGWSWYAGPSAADRTDRRFFGQDAHPERDVRPMQAYPRFHSITEKKFLGLTVAASTTPDAEGDLKVALDRLANHPNVGPFFGRQLIQRLVTSNPSPAYIGRVASVFNDNGAGVRGDLKAVFTAVLTDPEARTFNAGSTTFGKVREPILKLAHLLRAFKARSTSSRFTGLDDTDNASNSLGQTVLRSSSVFNFFRPSYVPPHSAVAQASMVAPELQLSNEVSVAGFLNYVRSSWLPVSATRDIQLDFSSEIALATDPAALVDRMNLLLMSGQMSADLRARVIDAVTDRSVPAATGTNQTAVDGAKRDRVCIAILLTMASPDYAVQK